MSGYDAYRKTQLQTGSSRDTEYRLLAQVTSALLAVKEDGETVKQDPVKAARLADALNWNKQVWDVFVEDCGTAGNQLPKELRAAIVSLGLWVTKETAHALDGQGDLDSLIAVNRDIMKGLRPRPAAEAGGPTDAAQPAPGQASRPIADTA